jgi:hypothetical protein
MIFIKNKITFFLFVILTLQLGCDCGPKLSKEDQAARNDDSSSVTDIKLEEVILFPDSQLGQKLNYHMKVLSLPTETIEEADQLYDKSLIELRKHPDEVIKLLSEAYKNIEENRYFDRWSLVKTLGDLQITEAYSVLSTIAKSTIPGEKLKDLHHFSTQEEEQIIRLRAVEGLAALAKQGHKWAEEDLLTLALNTDSLFLAIRKRAIKGYLSAGKDIDTRIEFLKSKLPKEVHGVITLETTPPEVFQDRVKALAHISKDRTTEDAVEEQLPKDHTPKLNDKKEK